MEETQKGNINTEVWNSLEEVLKSREGEKKQASNPGWEKNVTEGLKVGHVGVLGFVCLECRPCELSSRTSLSLHVVDLGHLAPLNLGSLIPKTW